MVWNISFQVAGLLICIVVAFMCLSQKRLNFRAERVFIMLLAGIIVCICLDILSIVAANIRNDIPSLLLQSAFEIYLFSIVVVSFLASRFAVAELSYNFKKRWKTMSWLPLVLELAILVIFKTSLFIDPEARSLYTYGVPVFTTYILCAIYLFTTFVFVVVLRDRIGKRRKAAMYFWILNWIVAATIQFFNNRLLIVSFAMSLSCLFMYCKLENPEYHLDDSIDVFNRKGFLMLMDECLTTKRHKSLIVVSIGNLSTINEIFGNKIGGRVIEEVCEYLQNLPGSTLFKLEERVFVAAFDSASNVEVNSEKITRRMGSVWEVSDVKVHLMTGVSYLKDIGIFKDVEELEEIVYYFAALTRKQEISPLNVDEEQLNLRKRTMEIQHSVEWALEHDSVEMFYQPIYNISAGRFTAMEALVRIRDENGKLLMPGDFIEFTEKNGMILRLGNVIFRKVCEFIQYNHIENYGIEYIEVNLSVVQCTQSDLAKELTNIMGEYQISPQRINLEITETAAVNTKDSLEKNMQDLLDYGTSFSLDDFGSGYSNLTYIVGMPLKIIKIDRSLTVEYDNSEKARIATDYSVKMIHDIGMEIVVEGIETEEQYANFKKLGVEYIQGYYFSRPLPGDRVLNYVQEWM